MELLISIIYLSLFLILIGRSSFYRFEAIPAVVIRGGFLLKVMAGVLVGLVYTYFYTNRHTADTFRFFDDSMVIYNALQDSPYDFFRMLTGIGADAKELEVYYNAMNNWYDVYSPVNDNRTMIRFNAFLRLISGGYYYVHVVILGFLSYTGIIAIVRVFSWRFPRLTSDIFLTFLLLPSVLFWGSGLLKDSLVFFALGLTMYGAHLWITDKKLTIGKFLIFPVMIMVLMFAKFQIFLLTLPLIIAWVISEKYKFKAPLVYLAVFTAVFLVVSLVGHLFMTFDLPALLAAKQRAFFELAKRENAGSLIAIPILEPTMAGLLKSVPTGFLTALTRPFFTDPGPAMSKFFTLENMLLLLFILWNVFKIRDIRILLSPIVLFCLFYAVIYLSVVGMVTPVLGAMVRYKAQALPFLVTLVILLSNHSGGSVSDTLMNKFRKI